MAPMISTKNVPFHILLASYILVWTTLVSASTLKEKTALVPRGRKNCACRAEEDVPLLEKDAGAVKGYYVVIIILSLLIALQTIAWFSFLYYMRRRTPH